MTKRSTKRPLRSGPLYDPRYEHDACGIGFVADAGGRSADRVLPLALDGLASLAHRGAFAADGKSSDGAGVSLPLDPDMLDRIVGSERSAPTGRRAGGRSRGPGVVTCFLPRRRVDLVAARAMVEAGFGWAGVSVIGWREVPTDPAALGPAAAATRPAFFQAVVKRPGRAPGDPRPMTDRVFEQRLVVGRRRVEAVLRAAGERFGGASIPSASCRTIVYKGLVDGGRLSELYPDLAPGLCVSYATFHQRFATNTRPDWRLVQPFRSIAHNGEINTIRGNREQFRGRVSDRGALAAVAGDLLQAGPLLSPDGSDSLSLDEALETLVTTGWDTVPAILAMIPEAPALRRAPHARSAALRRRTAASIAPWDGPGAFVFADGDRVGALVDRNGLRPAAFAITADRLVGLASEAGAIRFSAAETTRRGRLGPGELLLVEPRRGAIREDVEARTWALRSIPIHDVPSPTHDERMAAAVTSLSGRPRLAHHLRFLAGLDAERARLSVRTMALEGHEPMWSMGDDTPTPGRSRAGRPVTDHLRQSFAQVTNPAIDPVRERSVMDVRVELGRRPVLLRGLPRGQRTVRLARPVVADLDGLTTTMARSGIRTRTLSTVWIAERGTDELEAAIGRLVDDALDAAARGVEVLILSDIGFDGEAIPIPSVLACGAVHTALTEAGLRGRMDLLVVASDVLDVHSMAMTVAVGATAVHPWLALELGSELAGTRGAEERSAPELLGGMVDAFDAGLRKTLARMGISVVASYVGGGLFEVMDLHPSVIARCFPAAAAWPGGATFADLAARQLERARLADTMRTTPIPPGREPRLPDPGFARFRADGEVHLYAPRIAAEIQRLATGDADVERYRTSLARPSEAPAIPRDDLRIKRMRVPLTLREVEDARSIVRRFVVSAMSVGALSPEAHQALTVGIQRAGGAANTGEGGEDPAWYRPDADGHRQDARIKQVASARFGVTAAYLARADQLEIKIAQGSKPGEGGQLPGRKATAYIASLRRGQAGQSYISPPPHHDIYSIEDLAQLIADLRAINPRARIGVKLVASRGVGTVAAGVAKAGASYIHLSGHAGGTGASPLSSIKHVGAPWELGLAEVHQTLLRHDLRDRVALRTDGGLQTGRDLLVATLLGAEEFAFGTAALVAIGCDMARQCHLDTCPTGIATQREDLRAKFAGTPEMIERFVLALAEDLRRELAAVGARSVGELVGESRRLLAPVPAARAELAPVVGASPWGASPARRADPASADRDTPRVPASGLEARVAAAFADQESVTAGGLRLTTADRSFGAALTGAIERGDLAGPVHLTVKGAAGQSFGAFAGEGVTLRLVGQANDYVGKGLSGGSITIVPEPELTAIASSQAIAGNTVLYGATGGKLHLVGRAGMRFAVRNSGAEAVVEGIGPHGCEYMTGGTVVVLGPVGANFGAGMTGGRAYLYDPDGRHVAALDASSVTAMRLSTAIADRPDGSVRAAEIRRLLRAHRGAGSALAGSLLDDPGFSASVWLVEPIESDTMPDVEPAPDTAARRGSAAIAASDDATGPQPSRSRVDADTRTGLS